MPIKPPNDNDLSAEENTAQGEPIGRVIMEHRDHYTLKIESKEYDAELIGQLRFSAQSRYDLPVVGDYVTVRMYDEGKALILAIQPRHNLLERKVSGKKSEAQLIAANVSYGLIIQSVDRDFNLNRLDRYLVICRQAQIIPLILLSKTDLISSTQLEKLFQLTQKRNPQTTIIEISNVKKSYATLWNYLHTGKTYALLGSSGVGKSSLINGLLGRNIQETQAISSAVKKGKHTTTNRSIIYLSNGAMLIDNPGMRELGLVDAESGLTATFDEIESLSKDCKYKNCSHIHENHCAVLNALDEGVIDQAQYNHYLKLYKENAHHSYDRHTKKKHDKQLGKIIREVKKVRKWRKY